jgi:predicted O-linked N-acetylglucosamine transferase (SPINDLY family)
MSTGLKQMDYIIVDPYVVKQTDQKYYSEKFIFLNDIWCCYSNTSFLNIKVKKDLPLAANKFITFGSFNNLLKLNFEVIKVWSQILTNIPNSKLFLKNEMLGHEFIKERISKKFLDNGVKKDQLILEGLSPRSIFLQCYNRIDIALDTFPYNGGSTSFESSKMLVPLLTKQGNFFVSRCGLSINKNLMMDDWIADTNNSYIEKAISFSNNIDYLYSINKKLESTVDTSPLFNTEMFYKNLKKKIFELIKN